MLATDTDSAASSAHQVDKREAYACDECSIPLAEARPRCWHCDQAAASDLPTTDLRDAAA